MQEYFVKYLLTMTKFPFFIKSQQLTMFPLLLFFISLDLSHVNLSALLFDTRITSATRIAPILYVFLI
jgi:hypothetical protein